MQRISLALALAFTCAFTGLSAAAGEPGPNGPGIALSDKVVLTGCVVKGDDGFLLSEAVPVTTTSTTTVATPAGTTGITTTTTTTPPAPRMLYLLDDDDKKLDGHSGHKVEITGEVKGDVEKGEVKVERDNGMAKLEIKSDGRKVKAVLPEMPAAIGTAGGDKKKVELDYLVRKLDVKSVKMISASCQ